MKLNLFLLFSLIGLMSVFSLPAKALTSNEISEITNAYRYYKDVSAVSIQVPTVVEVPFRELPIDHYNFVVLDQNTNLFEPHLFVSQVLDNEVPVKMQSVPAVSSLLALNDKDLKTAVDFPLLADGVNELELSINSATPFISSSLILSLDNYVALPQTVEIKALLNGKYQTVLAKTKVNAQSIYFPSTTAQQWMITFTYGQPLRIKELKFVQGNANPSIDYGVRFLAQPDHNYRIYLDTDREVKIPVGEAADLSSKKDVLFLDINGYKNNSQYKASDYDKDGIADLFDNCVFDKNFNQEDLNANGRGDVCDDFDKDGIVNPQDNCINNPNSDQSDEDGDNIGDVCDTEESRLTERHAWLPWAGIGFAAVVLLVLLVLTAKSMRADDKS